MVRKLTSSEECTKLVVSDNVKLSILLSKLWLLLLRELNFHDDPRFRPSLMLFNSNHLNIWIRPLIQTYDIKKKKKMIVFKRWYIVFLNNAKWLLICTLTAVGGDTKGLLATSKYSKEDINRSSTGKDAIRFKLTFNLANFKHVNSVKN